VDDDRGRYRRLKWTTIISPTIFVAVAETFRYFFLRQWLPPASVSLVAVVFTLVGAAAFSTYVFGEIERIEGERRAYKDAMMALHERERLAREMHDGLAQNLAAINLMVHRLRAMVEGQRWSALPELLTEIQSAVNLSYAEVRQSLYDLKASRGVVAKEGFWATLSRQADDFAKQTGIRTRVQPLPNRQEPWNELASVEILRIVQESLANVRKHADATEVEIDAYWEDGTVVVRVRDNGRGFDPGRHPGGEAADGHHFGLSVMEERAASVGGRLHIESQPGRGTTVRIVIPVAGRGGNPGGKRKIAVGG
jgi:signal transduction histidine kinase